MKPTSYKETNKADNFTKECPGQANATDGGFQLTREHNNIADPIDVEEFLFLAGCKSKAKESAFDFRRIVDEQSAMHIWILNLNTMKI